MNTIKILVPALLSIAWHAEALSNENMQILSTESNMALLVEESNISEYTLQVVNGKGAYKTIAFKPSCRCSCFILTCEGIICTSTFTEVDKAIIYVIHFGSGKMYEYSVNEHLQDASISYVSTTCDVSQMIRPWHYMYFRAIGDSFYFLALGQGSRKYGAKHLPAHPSFAINMKDEKAYITQEDKGSGGVVKTTLLSLSPVHVRGIQKKREKD